MSTNTFLVNIAGYTSWLFAIGTSLFVVLVGGIYFAIHPGSYRRGLVMLFPRRMRAEAAETVDVLGRALKLWLLGQLLAMLAVGVMTTAGLWLLGIPSALALGFIAALLEFVPYLGPILSAMPALAVALAESPYLAMWVVLLYLVVQQFDQAFIVPLIQQRTVNVPPGVTLFAIVAFGLIFGPLGVLFASPLTVVTFVAVKQLWLKEVLDEPVAVLDEETKPKKS